MPWLFTLILAAHVGAGAVALTSFWGAVATRKGGPAHRRWGRVFAAAIYLASAMALGMGTLSLFWPLAMHPGLTDEALYRGLFGWMMLYLAVLTLSMTRYGLMMVANKRDHGANRHWTMVALQIVVLVAAVNCAVHGVILEQPLMILVSVIGFGTTLTYLWYMFRNSPGRTDYIPEHLKAMVATGIAAYTAFLSVGLVDMFPAHAFNPVIWAVPTVIGMGLIIWFLRRLKGPQKVVAAE
jgi:predicted permease